LERYTLWLESLPADQRREILRTTDLQERLRRIKAVFDSTELNRLYPDERASLGKVPAGEGQERKKMELLRQEEERRRDWLIAFRNLETGTDHRSSLADYPPPVRQFVNLYLHPQLSRDEEQRFKQAEGHWPLFPRTLVELSDRHPIRLPGPARGPSRFDDLPEELRNRLNKQLTNENRPIFNRLRASEGRWPEYAMMVTQVAEVRKIELPKQLGPSTPTEFSVPILRFVREKLRPVLKQEERTRLEAAEGKWPLYPRTLLELASKHQMKIPGESARLVLPAAPSEPWDRYRVKPLAGREVLPDLPDQTLRDFAQTELTSFQRAELPFFSFDAQSRERLKQEYFSRHRVELDQLRQADKKSSGGSVPK
jgi:hypothetical protein